MHKCLRRSCAALLSGLLIAIGLNFATPVAGAALWQPNFGQIAAGGYCKADVIQGPDDRRGPREARYGPIIVRDYEQPIRPLLRESGAKSGSRLAFGPPAIHIQRADLGTGQRLRIGQGRFGLVFKNSSKRSSGQLSWRAVASIASLGQNGTVTRTLIKHQLSIRAIAAGQRRQILLPTGSIPGLYRFDMLVESQNGRQRNRFVDFVRVLAPELEVGLSTEKKSYRPGDFLYARVENFGSSVVTESAEYAVETQVQGSNEWRRVGPVGVGFPRGPGLPLGPGRARCFGIVIPAEVVDGEYRIVKQVMAGASTVTIVSQFSIP
jgi:hypothetical protein